MLELDLVSIKNRKTGLKQCYGLNESHYNGMLASGGSAFDYEYSWEYLGSVVIGDDILNECGYFYKDE